MSGAGFCVGFPLSLIASSSFLKKKSVFSYFDISNAPDKTATKHFCLPLLGALLLLLAHIVHGESKFE